MAGLQDLQPRTRGGHQGPTKPHLDVLVHGADSGRSWIVPDRLDSSRVSVVVHALYRSRRNALVTVAVCALPATLRDLGLVTMRARRTSHGLTAHLVAGTHTVLIGMDLEDPTGCLGFAIRRTDHTEGETVWCAA